MSQDQLNQDQLSRDQFVFVVCGAQEYLDTLHYSLKALRHYSRNRIVVVTDTTRNEGAIEWPDVVDVRTPEAFNHHQASIYLKTGLHRFLLPGYNYCYLDTDVIALKPEVDTIFAHWSAPITFAPDCGRVHQFSPYAVKCGCREHYKSDAVEVAELLKHHHMTLSTSPPPRLRLRRYRRAIKRRLRSALASLHLSTTSHNDQQAYFTWDDLVKEMEARTPWRFNPETQSWVNLDGRDAYHLRCNHLVERIQAKFGIRVADPQWQNWNGGVFLFNDESHPFLEAWHQKTMTIFADPAWSTRDQGTLIATVWEFGLQDAPLLSREFNFIVDHGSSDLALTEDRSALTNDGFATTCVPAFAHVFYHFGDTEWDIWNWIEARIDADIGRAALC